MTHFVAVKRPEREAGHSLSSSVEVREAAPLQPRTFRGSVFKYNNNFNLLMKITQLFLTYMPLSVTAVESYVIRSTSLHLQFMSVLIVCFICLSDITRKFVIRYSAWRECNGIFPITGFLILVVRGCIQKFPN